MLNFPIPLTLAKDGRILFPSLEPVQGWAADDLSGTGARPLFFPHRLLKAQRSTEIYYACNLPSPFAAGPATPPVCRLFGEVGTAPSTLSPDFEDEFRKHSLTGGRTELFSGTGKRSVILFRWACLSAERSIGALWRCYARLIAGTEAKPWAAMDRGYFFDARTGGGQIFDSEACAIDLGEWDSVSILHEGPSVTQMPCSSGLVKVTRLSANGHPERALFGLRLGHDGGVAAAFSDGRQERFATAAMDRIDFLRAA